MTLGDSILIAADPAALFRLSQDYSRRLEWDPFLRFASLVGGAREAAVGVRALCVDRNSTAMETEYVSFNPPRATAIKMTRGPWFLESFAGAWRFDEVEPGSYARRVFITAFTPGRDGYRGHSLRFFRVSSLVIRVVACVP